MYTDMYRLAYAKLTICSVSTFCLWPAISSTNAAFVPRTPLFVGGNINVNLGFEWIQDPGIVYGAKYSRDGDARRLISELVKKRHTSN